MTDSSSRIGNTERTDPLTNTTPEEWERYLCGEQSCAKHQHTGKEPWCFSCWVVAQIRRLTAERDALKAGKWDALLAMAGERDAALAEVERLRNRVNCYEGDTSGPGALA